MAYFFKLPSSTHDTAQSRSAKRTRIPTWHLLKHLRVTRGNTNKCPHKPAHAIKQALAEYGHTHTHAKQLREGGVIWGASSFSQAGYLQTLVLHQPGETSPGLRLCLGGAWGLGRWTWTCPPRSHQRTKTHLQRHSGRHCDQCLGLAWVEG